MHPMVLTALNFNNIYLPIAILRSANLRAACAPIGVHRTASGNISWVAETAS